MEIRNWGYVAQSPRIADPLSFYGDPELVTPDQLSFYGDSELELCVAVTPDQLSFYGDPELELCGTVT